MSNVMVWILSGIIGVLASLAASGLFLYCMSRLRPKLEISPVISRGINKAGEPSYYVKVINRTRYPVIGVQARMSIATPQNIAGGTVYHVEPIPLRTSEIMELARFSRKDEDAHYAVQF